MHRIQPAIATAERVARSIIPDLAGRPLYVCEPSPDSMLTRELTGHRSGLFYPGLDLALQPELRRQGRWRGPGVAVAVDAWALFVCATHDDDGLRAVVGTLLHELAHWLDRPEPAEPSPTPYSDLLAVVQKTAERQAAPRQFPPGLVWHDESFVRLCCHLWYRASRGGGMVLRPVHLRFGSDYNGLEMLHSPGHYIDALWSELQEHKHLPLRTVAALEQPAEFTRLWDEDLRRACLPAHDAA